jgi:CDP-diacylglycerol--serine O-phosphatidyltransferase
VSRDEPPRKTRENPGPRFQRGTPAVKKIAVVPTLLTLGNGVCGFASIAFASKITAAETIAANEYYFVWAGWFILFAMLFDMLDGYVARLSKTASNFGGELDSLCDAISFGAAPAFLLLKLGPGWDAGRFFHQVLAGIAALYLACTVLRLARFNVENSPDAASHKRFRGLPSPGAAGCVASLAIVRGALPAMLVGYFPHAFDLDASRAMATRMVEVVSPLGALIVALLMVSNVPYPHVTGRIFRGKRRLNHLIQVLLAVFLIAMIRELAPLLIFWVYALLFPVYAVTVRALRPVPELPPPATSVDEHRPH